MATRKTPSKSNTPDAARGSARANAHGATRRSSSSRLLTSREAASRLGIQPATLYAYVSRGLLRSRPGDSPRSRLYAREDIEALERQRSMSRTPAEAAQAALDWGAPVLDSSIALIDDGKLYYRGEPVERLAVERNFEEVTALLWGLPFDAAASLFPRRVPALAPAMRKVLAPLAAGHPSDAMCVLLRHLLHEDIGAASRSADANRRSAAFLIVRLISHAAGLEKSSDGGLAGALARGWGNVEPRAHRRTAGATDDQHQALTELLNSILIVCADHEFNVSTFTARCVASAGATPYDIVNAGLCALRGRRHGGHADRVEAMLSEVGIGSAEQPVDRDRLERLLTARLQRGERLPGFAHPLYPQGDPRFSLVMDRLARARPNAPGVEALFHLAELAEDLVGEKPTVDLGLAAVSTTIGRAPGGAFTLFALGRIAGWIAHALEEAERGRLIRPRARYIGKLPTG